ncbi:hypothetical protein tb265_01740 [Gemmatimonadetes bacterium T265]|nr:hypothetical protein tb265_01740 [Gemmatimonadetes bacterium T265]
MTRRARAVAAVGRGRWSDAEPLDRRIGDFVLASNRRDAAGGNTADRGVVLAASAPGKADRREPVHTTPGRRVRAGFPNQGGAA